MNNRIRYLSLFSIFMVALVKACSRMVSQGGLGVPSALDNWNHSGRSSPANLIYGLYVALLKVDCVYLMLLGSSRPYP